jgi:NADPH-dependent curcumin reductase CurA
MTTLLVDNNSLQAQSFLNFARTLAFVKTVDKQEDFQAALSQCDATTVDAFFDEVDKRIKKRYANA